jgi:hypothetical protein
MMPLLTTSMVYNARSLVTLRTKNVKELSLMLCFKLMTSHPLMFCYTQMGTTLLLWCFAMIHPRFGLRMPRVLNGPNTTAHLQHKGLFANMLYKFTRCSIQPFLMVRLFKKQVLFMGCKGDL